MVRAALRILSLLLTAFVLFAASRALIRALPGDPLETLVAESGTTLSIEVLREELRLDEPFLTSLGHDVRRALRGDFGTSLAHRSPIAPILADRARRTAILTFATLIIALAISLPLGLAAAQPMSRLGSAADRLCELFGAIWAAIPLVWIAPILMIFLCVWLPIFPLGNHWALPTFTLALSYASLWCRLIRERVRETLERGAATGARARGIPEWKVRLKYGLAPCSGALLAYLGTQIGALLGGVIVTEAIFDWRGMGGLLVEAVLKRDYPVVETTIFFTGLAALAGTALGDAMQSWVDPRLDEAGR